MIEAFPWRICLIIRLQTPSDTPPLRASGLSIHANAGLLLILPFGASEPKEKEFNPSLHLKLSHRGVGLVFARENCLSVNIKCR